MGCFFLTVRICAGLTARSRNEPCVFFHTVKGDKRHHDRNGLDVFLVFGIVTVVFVLTELQSAGTAEHNEDNTDIADCHDDPLPAADKADAGDENARPEDHFAEIVGATDKSVKPRVHEALRIFLLGVVFLSSVAEHFPFFQILLS